jgi:hypothetical protein
MMSIISSHIYAHNVLTADPAWTAEGNKGQRQTVNIVLGMLITKMPIQKL